MFNHRYAEISIPWSMLRQTRALIREKVQRSLGSSLDIIGILFLFGSDEKRRERESSGCVLFIPDVSVLYTISHMYYTTTYLPIICLKNFIRTTIQIHITHIVVMWISAKKIESKKLFTLCTLQHVTLETCLKYEIFTPQWCT